jgi:peroxidase
MDGTCNNLQNPWWGAANTPYKRLLRAEYDDGLSSMRQNSVIRNSYLPNTRKVATTLHKANPTKSVWSNFAVSFGQSIAHDIAGTYGPKNQDGSNFVCDCNSINDHCYNIPIPEKDAFYKKNSNMQCYPFTRNQASVRDYECNYGPREQLNRHSHFLDLRFIYANSENTRARKEGLLSVSINALGEYTFKLKNPNGCPYGRGEIYHTGDENGEQNVYLTGVQNIWLRNHNQLAETLRRINAHWDDETLFQEARRINIAMYQHVIYSEYLPQLIGPAAMRIFDLEPLTKGYSNKYNPELYPQLLNEFVTAAYRHHFLVHHKQCWADERMKLFGCHDLVAGMKNSSHSCWSVDEVIRGQIAQASYYSTPQINWFINNVLLHQPSSIGVLNIQRGRDHGLRSYNHYRELCGLNRAKSFDELYNIPPSVRNQLKSLYAHVDDIDAWSGMTCEIPVKDAFIGHTFACIIGKQFQDLKRGDRFYYESNHPSSPKFTPEQLNLIRSTSLAALLCRNMDAEFIPKWPFLLWNPKTNPFVRCQDIARASLAPWKEVL